ncbi:hypothetical protein ABH920_002902 [Catenulispora sp. EB89]|uniref:hypothetical protein n=1 Tax=Catenulispora sp. EB89 TaxID=3156257 RepID=UPI003517CDB0
MTTTDWIIDIALVLIVFRQLREERISKATFIVPLAMITWAASQYLHAIPTAGNDLALIALFTGVGAVFGLFGGLLTRVRTFQGHARIKATAGAAALWVLSMGFRLAFAVWSTHASGERHLASFSVTHHITSGQAWVDALILMALAEVVVRLSTIAVRAWKLSSRPVQSQNQNQSQTWNPDLERDRDFAMEMVGRV